MAVAVVVDDPAHVLAGQDAIAVRVEAPESRAQVPHKEPAPGRQQRGDKAGELDHAFPREVRRRPPREPRLQARRLHGRRQLPRVQDAVLLPVHGPEERREAPDLAEGDLRRHVQEHRLLERVDAVEVQEAVQLVGREPLRVALVAEPGVGKDLRHGRPPAVVAGQHQPQELLRLLAPAEVLQGRPQLHAARVGLHLLRLRAVRRGEGVGVDLQGPIGLAVGGRLVTEQSE
mmetsp:Transcript_104993/g.306751  ORF Transcript_104993/g.306751 Transcript_104993/m.306751 type:complete len:231 (-) Transcript_104993:1596-2288(-)